MCLIVVILPHFATACDVDACQIGTSTGMAVGCTAATTFGGVAAGLGCTVGAVFTFGASCALTIGATALIGGGCALASHGFSEGKGIIQISSFSSKAELFEMNKLVATFYGYDFTLEYSAREFLIIFSID